MDQNDVQKVRVHSIESFGAADGPGVRFIVFFTGLQYALQILSQSGYLEYE